MNASPTITAVNAACLKLSTAAGGLRSPLLLAIRLFWGWQFYLTGKGKLLHLDRTTALFTDLGIPMPGLNAAIAGTTECLGGLLLVIGLASRLAAIPLVVTMVVAYLTADIDVVKGVFSDPDAFVAASPFLFLLAALLILAFGPGKLSADHLIARRTGHPLSSVQTDEIVKP